VAIRYLLDTNTVSYVIKGNFPRVREKLLRVPMAEVGISVITEAELRFGAAKKPEATKLKAIVEEFLLRVEIFPWDSQAAQRYAEIRASLERSGEPMGNLDMMLSADQAPEDRRLERRDEAEVANRPRLILADKPAPHSL
jgi:tRNA(fMet)-specific endonuclease VapC